MTNFEEWADQNVGAYTNLKMRDVCFGQLGVAISVDLTQSQIEICLIKGIPTKRSDECRVVA